MNPVLVGGVWLLVSLDCALMGYRLAMGRSTLLRKRRYFQLATVRGGLLGLVPLAAVRSVGVVLVERGEPTVATGFDQAMGRFLIVGGCYASLILGASMLCALPSVTVRTAASVMIFGPLTLLRPLVVVLTIAVSLGPRPSTELIALGLLVAIPGVAIEPLLDRRIVRGGSIGRLVPGRLSDRRDELQSPFDAGG